jgi:hypothetical protein
MEMNDQHHAPGKFVLGKSHWLAERWFGRCGENASFQLRIELILSLVYPVVLSIY